MGVRSLAAALIRRLPISSIRFGPPKGTIPILRVWIENTPGSSETGPGSTSHWYEPVREAERIERKPPRTQQPPVHPKFVREYIHTHPPVYLACIAGARIVGTDGLVISPDDRVFEDSDWGQEWVRESAVMQALRLPKMVRQPGSYVTLLARWAWEYYHWVLDILPRLSILEKHGGIGEHRYIVPKGLRSFQRESLEILGVPGDHLVEFDSTHWEIEHLYFPSFVGRTGNPPAWACEWLRSRLMTSTAQNRHRRLYMSRRQAHSRRVANEDQLLETLPRWGFEIVLSENLSFAEQMELFSQAELVMGPHGAGLTNVLFSEDITLVEFFEPTYVNACYYALCNSMGHEYWYLIGDRRNDSDIEVPMASLESILAQAIG